MLVIFKQHHLKMLLISLLIGLPLLACAGNPTPQTIVMLTRLPTLTPTGAANVAGAPANTPLPPQSDPEAGVPAELATPPPLAPESEPTPQPVEEMPTEAQPEPATNSDAAPANGDSSPVVIITVNDLQEYIEIQNVSDLPQDLTGWSLVSELDSQKCNLAGTLDVGETLRIWALAAQAAQGGYNCGFSQEIWADEEADAAVLLNAAGVEVSRMD